MAHGPTDRQLLGAGGGRGQSARAGAGVAVGHRSLLPRLAGADRGLRDQRLGDLGGTGRHDTGIGGLGDRGSTGSADDAGIGHTGGGCRLCGHDFTGGGEALGAGGASADSEHDAEGSDAADDEESEFLDEFHDICPS